MLSKSGDGIKCSNALTHELLKDKLFYVKAKIKNVDNYINFSICDNSQSYCVQSTAPSNEKKQTGEATLEFYTNIARLDKFNKPLCYTNGQYYGGTGGTISIIDIYILKK